jgi:hypothetical protein
MTMDLPISAAFLVRIFLIISAPFSFSVLLGPFLSFTQAPVPYQLGPNPNGPNGPPVYGTWIRCTCRAAQRRRTYTLPKLANEGSNEPIEPGLFQANIKPNRSQEPREAYNARCLPG